MTRPCPTSIRSASAPLLKIHCGSAHFTVPVENNTAATALNRNRHRRRNAYFDVITGSPLKIRLRLDSSPRRHFNAVKSRFQVEQSRLRLVASSPSSDRITKDVLSAGRDAILPSWNVDEFFLQKRRARRLNKISRRLLDCRRYNVREENSRWNRHGERQRLGQD